MPEISMCKNDKCSLKLKCYRYVAVPSKYQSYMKFESDDFDKCFLDISRFVKTPPTEKKPRPRYYHPMYPG